MTITQLKYVLAVAEYQNFTVASNHCFVTQPTLSMQIQKLEDELETQIFNRNKKPIQLTEIGKKIVEQAKIIVNEEGTEAAAATAIVMRIAPKKIYF